MQLSYLIKNYSYFIEPCAKITLKKIHKKCKYECSMNPIPEPLGIK